MIANKIIFLFLSAPLIFLIKSNDFIENTTEQLFDVAVETTNSNIQNTFGNSEFEDPIGFHTWIQGILFILSIYNIFLFLQNRNKMFLFYSLFVSCLLIYFTHHSPDIFHRISISEDLLILFYGIQFLAYFFYTCYVREVVDSRTVIPKWDKVLKMAKICFLIFILSIGVLELIVSDTTLYKVILVMFILTEIFAVINYIIFYSIPGIPSKLLIAGSVIYLVLANFSLYGGLKIMHGYELSYSFNPGIFMEIGAIIESLIFALVIGYKINAVEKEKNTAQVQLLQKSIEASELKIVALKAQMNPHFIFNALNSINNFILKNNVEEASDYLTKFSKLIRKILKNSSEATIMLREEIATLKAYIQLEQLRIDKGFEFTFYNRSQMDLDTLRVPPLFLQPYVENAIWHGLSHKKGLKKLEICIAAHNEAHAVITIKDNGIGRKASSKLISNLNRRSFGTQITKERIHAIDRTAQVVIEDVFDATHTVCGTLVTISLAKITSTNSIGKDKNRIPDTKYRGL